MVARLNAESAERTADRQADRIAEELRLAADRHERQADREAASQQRAVDREAASQQRALDRSERQQDQERDSRTQWQRTVTSVLVGGLMALLGTIVVEHLKQTHNEAKAQAAVSSRALDIRTRLNSAFRSLCAARTAYLAHEDVVTTKRLLSEAKNIVKSVEAWLDARDLPRHAVIAALKQEHHVTDDTIQNMYAHIAYHRAALELRGEDGESEPQALKLLARSMALRTAARAHSTKLTDNELMRGRIKAADVLSRQNRSADALAAYARVRDLDLVGTFWVIRASNNAAVVHFGRREDCKALDCMQKVAQQTGAWLRRGIDDDSNSDIVVDSAQWWSDTSKVLQSAVDAANLARNCTVTSRSETMLAMINLGADDAVDVLHLPLPDDIVSMQPSETSWIRRACDAGSPPASERTAHVTVEHLGTEQGRTLAVECLERVKLMMRKYYTSRANCVCISCVPFSNALRGNADTASRLLDLVEAMLDDPWRTDSDSQLSHKTQCVACQKRDQQEGPSQLYAVHPTHNVNCGLAVFAELDRDWLQHEGITRLYAALGLALVELAGACDDHDTDDLRKHILAEADAITQAAVDRNSHDQPPLRGVHSCMAAVARARYLERTKGSLTDALEILTSPDASAAVPTESLLLWSMRQQLAAKQLREEQHDKSASLRAAIGVSPRVARWQATVLAYTLSMQRQVARHQCDVGGSTTPTAPEWVSKAQSALDFAVKPSGPDDTHPLSRVARGTEPSHDKLLTKPLSCCEKARVSAILQQLKRWREVVDPPLPTKAALHAAAAEE